MNFISKIRKTKPAHGSIFFSYKREDPEQSAKIEQIYEALSAHPLPIFRDQKDIRYGSDWKQVLEEALNECVCGLALFTKACLNSEYIKYEVEMLLRMNKLIPINIDDTPFTWGAETIQGPDLRDWYGQHDHDDWNKLVSELKQAASSKETDRARNEPIPLTKNELETTGGIQTIGFSENRLREKKQYFRDAPDLPLLSQISSGQFTFTQPNREQSIETIHEPFALSVAPITCRQWNRAASSGAKGVTVIDYEEHEEDFPVTSISWDEARSYVNWLNARSGLTRSSGYHLPSEVALAFASKGAEVAPEQSGDHPPSVTALPASVIGLKGMVGCLWQWTEDAFIADAKINGRDGDPHIDPRTALRTVYGGSWRTNRSADGVLRNGFDRTFKRSDIGFRVQRRVMT